MLREDNRMFFIHDKGIHTRRKKVNNPTEKQIKREIEKLNDQIDPLRIKLHYSKTSSNIEELNLLYQEKDFWTSFLQDEKNGSLKPQRKFKKKYKKMKDEKAYELILKRIINIKKDDSYVRKIITKEETSKTLEIREEQVERIFRKMNLEGILSQPKHRYPHDNNRNPYDGGCFSGWMSDIYEIRK